MLLVKLLNVCLIFRWMHNYSVTCLALETHSFQRLKRKKEVTSKLKWKPQRFFFFLYHFKKISEQICFQSSLLSVLRWQLPAAGWEKAKVSLKSNKTHMTQNCTILRPFVTTLELFVILEKIVKCLGVFFVRVFLKRDFLFQRQPQKGFLLVTFFQSLVITSKQCSFGRKVSQLVFENKLFPWWCTEW